jgi:hypothetical protein
MPTYFHIIFRFSYLSPFVRILKTANVEKFLFYNISTILAYPKYSQYNNKLPLFFRRLKLSKGGIISVYDNYWIQKSLKWDMPTVTSAYRNEMRTSGLGCVGTTNWCRSKVREQYLVRVYDIYIKILVPVVGSTDRRNTLLLITKRGSVEHEI